MTRKKKVGTLKVPTEKKISTRHVKKISYNVVNRIARDQIDQDNDEEVEE